MRTVVQSLNLPESHCLDLGSNSIKTTEISDEILYRIPVNKACCSRCTEGTTATSLQGLGYCLISLLFLHLAKN